MKLEDIVQKVVIEGDDGAVFTELGRLGMAAFEGVAEAARAAGTAIGLATAGLTIIIGLLVQVAFASQKFVEEQASLAKTLDATSKQLGITAGEALGLQTAFAKVGVDSPKVIQRALQQIAKDIGQAFTEIPRKVKEGQFAVEEAAQGIAGAQTSLSQSLTTARFASAEWSNKLRSDALSVAEAYNKVKFASRDAASQTANDALSVKGAQLNLREAEEKARVASGWEPNTAELEAIAKERGELQLKSAKQALEDVELRQAKNLAQAPLTQQRDQLGLDQARLQEQKDFASQKDALDQNTQAVEKATLAYEKAVFAFDEALKKNLPAVQAKLESGQSLQGIDTNTIADAIKKSVIEGGADVNKKGEFFIEELKKLEAGLQSGAIQAGQKGDVIRGFGVNVRQDQAKIENLDVGKLIEAMASLKESFGPETVQKLLDADAKITERKANDQVQQLRTASNIAPEAVALGDAVNTVTSTISEVISKVFETLNSLIASKAQQVPDGHAGGGYISGPGSSTSDSIPARLSNGEFVIRAAAVRNYGANFFHALNDMAIQGFAMGGLVSPSPVRFAEGGLAGGSQSVVNLTIDGNHFGGMKAPADVAQKLTSYAISRQTSATGRRPSWVR